MKTIGLIGGFTWYSTVEYYKLINQLVNEKLGGVSSAKIMICSLNFEEIKKLTEEDNWDKIAAIISETAIKLEKAGCDCIIISANTMHNIAGKVREAISIPLIHIAEEVASAIKKEGCSTVALLGTKYTMQLDFYKNILAEAGIRTIIPNDEEILYINTAIYTEMGKGLFLPATKQKFLEIIERLRRDGAEGIILGCTEIPLLIQQEDCRVLLFDTTFIHSKAAADFALK